jgi:hypothetical protein
LWSLEELRRARRPIPDAILDDNDVNHILANVLWSDPIDGVETSEGNRVTQVLNGVYVLLRCEVIVTLRVKFWLYSCFGVEF